MTSVLASSAQRETLGTLLAMSILFFGCSRSQGPQLPSDNTLVVALANAPIHLDPRVGSDQASGNVFQLMLNGLVTKDTRGNLLPSLAESWEILDGGRRYRFHLRSGVRFHDGREFSAADVVWTFTTILDGTVPTPKRGAFQQLERVVALDENTVEFIMREPFGAMLVNLTSYLGIIPAGSDSDQFNRRPIGTGPFRLVDRSPERFVFESFEEYWEGRAILDRIELREIPDATVRALELQKGSVQLVVSDLTPDVLVLFRTNPAYRVVEDPGAKYVYLGINLEDPILAHREVRRAMAMAIDRQKLVDTLWRGLGRVTESVLPLGHWARHEGLELIPYDVEKAKRLLDDAGFPDPDGLGPRPRFSLTYKTSTDETAVLQAQIIQAMLAEAGIRVEIRSHEFATFYSDIKKGIFQVFSLTRTGIIDPDIYNLILHSRSIPPAGANRGRYRNQEFDRMVDEGARLFVLTERLPFYLRAQEIMAHDLPYISLFNKVNFAVMPRQLEGYRNYPSSEFYSLKDMKWRR